MEVPHLIILSLIVHQHYGCVILRTSQLSSSAIAVQLDPDDTMLMEIHDKNYLDELEGGCAVTLALRDNVPFGPYTLVLLNDDLVTVRRKVLQGLVVCDVESIVLGFVEVPLCN